jgi:hypothetical protein
MQDYWLELLLLAYTVTCLDVMVTTWGIATGVGSEGNPIVTAVVPSSEPILQIIFMAATTAASFWFIFYGRKFISNQDWYYKFVSYGSVAACATHMFGIATWLV